VAFSRYCSCYDYYLIYDVDSESDDSSLCSQPESFRPVLDVKRFEQYITKEETKPDTLCKANTTTNKLLQPEATTSLKVTARNDQLSSMESSLCSITDMSSINADSGTNKDKTFNSNLSDVVGGKVQASLVLEGAGDDQKLDNSPLNSVLNPGKLQHANNTEVLTFVISVLYM